MRQQKETLKIICKKGIDNMENIKIGILLYDYSQNKPKILFHNGDFYGGLRCGDTFDIFQCNKWIPTRIEYSDAEECWYCTGIKNKELLGVKVRIIERM